MFSSINLTAAITRHVFATSSRKNYCYEWRNILSSSNVQKRSFQAASTSVSKRLFNTSYHLHLLYCSDATDRRKMFSNSCMLLDSRCTRKDGNDTKDTENHVGPKQMNDENKNTTTSALNQRAAGAILTQLTSIPNILTLSRIAATPYLSYLLITHHHTKHSNDVVAGIDTSSATTTASETIATHMDPSTIPLYALSLFLVMGFTDFLDGFIARKFPSTSTVLGTYLDPFADKVFISALSLTLWYTETLPGALVGLWVARDVGIVFSVYYLVKEETMKKLGNDNTNNYAVMDPQNTPLKVEASLLSKINTSLQIGLIALGIAGEVPSIEINADLMTSLCWVTAGTTVSSTIGYFGGSAFRKSGNK
eukprot:scaffold19153_cov80-Skeletonema_menzelii.AAC.13